MFIEREANDLIDLLLVFVYMTVGGTGRCSEITKWSYSNYNGRRSLKILNGSEILFLSQYHKTKYNDMSFACIDTAKL